MLLGHWHVKSVKNQFVRSRVPHPLVEGVGDEKEKVPIREVMCHF